MPRNFDVRALLKDRRMVVRSALGALLLANLLAAVFAFHVLGGSPEDLAEQMRSKQRDLAWQLQQTERMRTLVAKVQQAKVEGDKFLDDCTMERASAYSTLIDDLNRMAAESGMQTKESSYVLDPVEGSEQFEQITSPHCGATREFGCAPPAGRGPGANHIGGVWPEGGIAAHVTGVSSAVETQDGDRNVQYRSQAAARSARKSAGCRVGPGGT